MSEYTYRDAALIVGSRHEDFDGRCEPIEVEGDQGRWHQWTVGIYKDKSGQQWAVHWGRGLTEMQEHEFNDAPVKVESREVKIPGRIETGWFAADSSGWIAGAKPVECAGLSAVTPVREPNQFLIDELEDLLAQAKAGDLRGILFVAYQLGTVDHRYGSAGSYSLADYALGVKLMELELDSIVTSGATPD